MPVSPAFHVIWLRIYVWWISNMFSVWDESEFMHFVYVDCIDLILYLSFFYEFVNLICVKLS